MTGWTPAARAAFFNDGSVEQDEESLFVDAPHPYDDLVVLVTASQQLADHILICSHGFPLSVPSKLAGASDSKHRQIHDAFEKTGRHWLYNATSRRVCRSTTPCAIDRQRRYYLSISGIFSGSSPGCSCNSTVACRLPNWWIRRGSRA